MLPLLMDLAINRRSLHVFGMKFIHEQPILAKGAFSQSADMTRIREEIHIAIQAAVWPPGSSDFSIYPQSGKKRGEGNGVKPIKLEVMRTLHERFGWELEYPSNIGLRGTRRTGEIDAAKTLKDGSLFALEWETGNVSSSHRSLNKLALGILQNVLIGGTLIVPTADLARYLTDRIGNYEELSPYFPLWGFVKVNAGYLSVISVEHDRTDASVLRIPKGTDGRAAG
jgi:hypothetical protein